MPESKLRQTLSIYFLISKVKCRFLAIENQRTTVQRSAVWMFLQHIAAPADTDSLMRVTRFFRDHLAVSLYLQQPVQTMENLSFLDGVVQSLIVVKYLYSYISCLHCQIHKCIYLLRHRRSQQIPNKLSYWTVKTLVSYTEELFCFLTV